MRREGRQQSDDEDEYDDNDTMNNDHYQHYYPLYCCYHPAVVFFPNSKSNAIRNTFIAGRLWQDCTPCEYIAIVAVAYETSCTRKSEVKDDTGRPCGGVLTTELNCSMQHKDLQTGTGQAAILRLGLGRLPPAFCRKRVEGKTVQT